MVRLSSVRDLETIVADTFVRALDSGEGDYGRVEEGRIPQSSWFFSGFVSCVSLDLCRVSYRLDRHFHRVNLTHLLCLSVTQDYHASLPSYFLCRKTLPFSN